MFTPKELQHALVETTKGWYFAGDCNLDSGFVYSDLVDDFYWNYFVLDDILAEAANKVPGYSDAGRSETIDRIIDYQDLEKVIKERSAQLVALGRQPTIYIDASNVGSVEKTLFDNSFALVDQEAVLWLDLEVDQLEHDGNAVIGSDSTIGSNAAIGSTSPTDRSTTFINRATLIESSTSQSKIDEFLSVFASASTGSPDEPYGSLDTSSYVECLRRSMFRRDTWHLYCEKDGEIVGVVSLAAHKSMMGIYNLAVDPKHRRGGFGIDLTIASIEFSKSKGAKFAFMQTGADSFIHRQAEKFSFNTAYIGNYYTIPSK